MGALRVLTAAEQVAEYLRAELCRGAWGGTMPGVPRWPPNWGSTARRWKRRCGCLSGRVAGAAGSGPRRRIALPAGKVARPLRVAILD